MDDGSVIPDVVVFPEQFPTPSDPDPQLLALDDLHFAEVLFDVLTGVGDLEEDIIKKTSGGTTSPTQTVQLTKKSGTHMTTVSHSPRIQSNIHLSRMFREYDLILPITERNLVPIVNPR
jgi:hypothetical protein